MGDGKALQMGTSHELGQNFAGPSGSSSSTSRAAADGVDHVVGRVHPHGRRPDHGARRRRRPARPARAAGGRVVAVRDRATSGRGGAASPTVSATACVNAIRRRRRMGLGACATDWELKGVAARGRDRATSPRASPPWFAASTGEKSAVPGSESAGAVRRARSPARRPVRRGEQRPGNTVDVRRSRTHAMRATTGWGSVPWDGRRPEGEGRTARRRCRCGAYSAATVRCRVPTTSPTGHRRAIDPRALTRVLARLDGRLPPSRHRCRPCWRSSRASSRSDD